MTSDDFDAFYAEFERLSSALERYKTDPAQRRTRADAYFHVLKKLPLPEVVAKADAWLAKEKKFPAPVEWLNVVTHGRARDYRVMADDEAREWRRAEHSRWRADPCKCETCLEAGIDHQPVRFVPRDRLGELDQAVEPVSGRTVIAGHWIHGEALVQWYAARAGFFASATKTGHGRLLALVP